MFWEFEDGLTNTITGATESAGRMPSAWKLTWLPRLAGQSPGLAGSFCWPPRPPDDRLVAVTEQSTGDVVPERWNAVGPKSNMWMDPAQDPRFAAGAELEGERATLLDYLRAYRLALELKCAGLDAEQLARRSVPPSTMSLLGLVRHMADVERNWFRRVMAQADAPPLYWSDDVEDADWAGAVADPAVVADAWRAWHEEVAFAEQFVAGSPDLIRPQPHARWHHRRAARGDTPHGRGVRPPPRPRRPAPRAD
jgi:uncharacterized damage-inducible protein DinB